MSKEWQNNVLSMLKKEKRHDSAHKNLPGVNNSNAGILQILNRCAFGSGRDVFKKHDSANERTGKAWKRSMKATGIVRRIDDLGRVVIPKKIRRISPRTNPPVKIHKKVVILLPRLSYPIIPCRTADTKLPAAIVHGHFAAFLFLSEFFKPLVVHSKSARGHP